MNTFLSKETPFLFANGRGQQLSGVLHVPQDTFRPPVLIMSHGFTDDKVSDNRLFVKFARQALFEGYAVLRFDYAGSGDSEGDFADMTITREIEDLESAIAYIRAVPELALSPIYLIGYSLGGAVALSAAARDLRIHGFVGWAPVSNPLAVFHAILGEKAFCDAEHGMKVLCRNDAKQFVLKPSFFSDLTKHQPLRDIADLSPRPALLVQGTADTKVLPDQTMNLFLSSGEPRTLRVINGAPHSFAFFEDELFRITFRHLRTWIGNYEQLNRSGSKPSECSTPGKLR